MNGRENEVVKNALCTLVSIDNEKFTAVTDGFGDFWFKDLPDSTFCLTIAAKGFETKTIDRINTKTDVNLGDIVLDPA